MSDPGGLLRAVESQVRALARCASPGEVFRRLLSATGIAAPRSSIFLLQGDRWRGWGSTGYAPEAADRQRAAEWPSDSPPLGELLRGGEAEALHLESVPDFGQPDSSEAIAAPVRAGERLVAAVLSERAPDETPWHPEVVAILAHVAGSRLEAELLRRRREPPATAPDPAAPRRDEAAVVGYDPTASTPESGLAPVSEADSRRPDARRRQEARRFARLVATDIRLYNEEAVLQGRRHGDLARRLAEHLRRGRETFLRRFQDLGPEAIEHLRDAYVEVLAAGDGSLLPADPKDW